MTLILLALRWFYKILVMLILIRGFGSWFVRNHYGSKWYSVVIQLTEPMLAPCRRIMSRFQMGMMADFSPVLALLLLSAIYRLLFQIIYFVLK